MFVALDPALLDRVVGGLSIEVDTSGTAEVKLDNFSKSAVSLKRLEGGREIATSLIQPTTRAASVDDDNDDNDDAA